MKNSSLLLTLFFAQLVYSQVGVNTTNPDPSSMLDIASNDKGVLVPRVNLANIMTSQLDGTNTAATGLLIWNTNATTVGGNGIGFYFFNGTQWRPIRQTITDDQTIDNFSLNGTTLRLSLENDGQPLQTVNLASLVGTDDQNLTTPTLVGTTLNLGIENGTGTSINLATLQDGNTQNTLDQAYDEGGSGVGRTITADNGAVVINGTDGFQNTGIFGSGATLALTGAGTRMFFYPRKAAFRAGYVNDTQWNNANVGNYSTAFGINNTASGARSVAFGNNNTLSGDGATAFGNSNNVSGFESFALGSVNVISADNGAAFGESNEASGYSNFLAGIGNTTSGESSIAIGQNNEVTGDISLAFGASNIVNSDKSVAIGTNLQTFSGYETVVGVNSTNYTPVTSTGFSNADRLFVVGNGATIATRSNALTIYKDGRMNINDAYTLPLTDGTANQILTTDGAGTTSWTNQNQYNVSNFALAKISMSNSQTIPTFTFTKVNYDTILFEIGSNYNTANNRYTATETGYYRITASYSTIGAANAESQLRIYIYKNGSAVKHQSQYQPQNSYGVLETFITNIEFLSPGDYIEIYATSFYNSKYILNSPITNMLEIERIR